MNWKRRLLFSVIIEVGYLIKYSSSLRTLNLLPNPTFRTNCKVKKYGNDNMVFKRVELSSSLSKHQETEVSYSSNRLKPLNYHDLVIQFILKFLISFSLSFVFCFERSDNGYELSVPSAVASSLSLEDSETQIINLFEENIPSVVYINTYTETINVMNMNVLEVPVGSGSGIVWDDKGHILTNYHVIRNAKSAKVIVTSPDGKSTEAFDAAVSGVDPDKDIAVLDIGKTNKPWKFKPIKVGKSSSLRVGQFAMAIGNPFGTTV